MESLHLDHLLDVLGLGGGHALHHHGAAPHRHAAHVRDRLEEGLEGGAAEPPEGNVLPRLLPVPLDQLGLGDAALGGK